MEPNLEIKTKIQLMIAMLTVVDGSTEENSKDVYKILRDLAEDYTDDPIELVHDLLAFFLGILNDDAKKIIRNYGLKIAE